MTWNCLWRGRVWQAQVLLWVKGALAKHAAQGVCPPRPGDLLESEWGNPQKQELGTVVSYQLQTSLPMSEKYWLKEPGKGGSKDPQEMLHREDLLAQIVLGDQASHPHRSFLSLGQA